VARRATRDCSRPITSGATPALDALENLPKERPGQVIFGELQREVPRVPDQPPARLEQPLLEARERPVLLVSDQFWMAAGSTSRRSRLPRL
jgi:hypothetical protein